MKYMLRRRALRVEFGEIHGAARLAYGDANGDNAAEVDE